VLRDPGGGGRSRDGGVGWAGRYTIRGDNHHKFHRLSGTAMTPKAVINAQRPPSSPIDSQNTNTCSTGG
jgi:hypothetical protein